MEKSNLKLELIEENKEPNLKIPEGNNTDNNSDKSE